MHLVRLPITLSGHHSPTCSLLNLFFNNNWSQMKINSSGSISYLHAALMEIAIEPIQMVVKLIFKRSGN